MIQIKNILLIVGKIIHTYLITHKEFQESSEVDVTSIISLNHELRRYAFVRDSNLKMLLLLQNQASRKFVDKHKFLPLPRNKTQ